MRVMTIALKTFVMYIWIELITFVFVQYPGPLSTVNDIHLSHVRLSMSFDQKWHLLSSIVVCDT